MGIRPDLFINRAKLKSSYKWKTISLYQLNDYVKLWLLFQQNKINNGCAFGPNTSILCVLSWIVSAPPESPELTGHLIRYPQLNTHATLPVLVELFLLKTVYRLKGLLELGPEDSVCSVTAVSGIMSSFSPPPSPFSFLYNVLYD